MKTIVSALGRTQFAGGLDEGDIGLSEAKQRLLCFQAPQTDAFHLRSNWPSNPSEYVRYFMASWMHRSK
ncbi:hypothetical protein ASG50_24885 [Rhizobium sp. Leaf386]|nr:hypothetical protein ASG50_24885 [Rhizobium sp. Leaf386]